MGSGRSYHAAVRFVVLVGFADVVLALGALDVAVVLAVDDDAYRLLWVFLRLCFSRGWNVEWQCCVWG